MISDCAKSENPRAVAEAIRLSAGVLSRDPSQLRSHLISRLQGDNRSDVQKLLKDAAGGDPGPWLMPLNDSLRSQSIFLYATIRAEDGIFEAHVRFHRQSLLALLSGGGLVCWGIPHGRVRWLKSKLGVYCFDVDVENQCVVCALDDGTICFFAVKDGRELLERKLRVPGTIKLAAVPGKDQIVCALEDNSIRMIDAAGRTIWSGDSHADRIVAMSLTPDGRHCVTASGDNTVCVWDLKHGVLIQVMKDHLCAVTDVKASQDGKQVVASAWDNTIRVWDLATGLSGLAGRGVLRPVSQQTVATSSRQGLVGPYGSCMASQAKCLAESLNMAAPSTRWP